MNSAHILPPGGASTLHNLTKLAKPVEGTIVARADGVSRITTRVNNGKGAPMPDESLQTVCVDRYRILSPSDPGKLGTTVEGRARLRGLFVTSGKSTVGVAASVTGSLGKQSNSVGAGRKPVVVTFFEKDRSAKSCVVAGEDGDGLLSHLNISQQDGTDFLTQTTLMPLAPVASTLDRIGSGGTGMRLLVACVNGIYALQALPSTIISSAEERSAVLNNLVETVRYVVDARPTGVSGGFICRVSHDTIVALVSREDTHKVVDIQRVLRSGPYRGLDTAVHSGGVYVVSQSLLEVTEEEGSSGGDPTDPFILRQAAEAAFGADAKILVEPLSHWQTPPVAIDVSVVITARFPLDPASSEPVPIDQKFLLHGGQLGVSVRGTRPTIRPLRVAEEPGSPENHFSRVLSQTLQKQLARLPNGAASQQVLDGVTQATAAELRETLTSADVFAVPIEVRMNIKQLRTPGTLVTLPSGLSCVVPVYATDSSSPRLSAVLGVLPSLGVGVIFVPWTRAEVSGVPLGW